MLLPFRVLRSCYYNKIDFDDDADTSISSATDDTLVIESGGVNIASITAGEFAINEGSADIDFRVESNGRTNMLFVDGGNNEVVIQKASSGATSTAGSVLIVEDDDNAELSILGGSSSVLAINFGHSGDADDAIIAYNTTSGSENMSFTVNAAERARITSSGQFLVGATTSSRFFNIESDLNSQYALHIEHTQAAPYGIFLQYTGAAPDATNDNYAFYFSDTGAARFYIGSDGDVYNHDNAYNQISDERIKQNITDANSQWDDIKALKVRNFVLKDDARAYGDKAKIQIGVVAQEAESVCPKLVTQVKPSPADVISSSEFGTLYEDGDELPVDTKVGDVKEVKDHVKGFRYSVLYMKAIKALQEAQTRIETLETKVAALEGN